MRREIETERNQENSFSIRAQRSVTLPAHFGQAQRLVHDVN